jgi:hypothetical protein
VSERHHGNTMNLQRAALELDPIVAFSSHEAIRWL